MQGAKAGILDYWLTPPTQSLDVDVGVDSITSNPGFTDDISTSSLIPRSAVVPR
jgi:hypothetical protein